MTECMTNFLLFITTHPADKHTLIINKIYLMLFKNVCKRVTWRENYIELY